MRLRAKRITILCMGLLFLSAFGACQDQQNQPPEGDAADPGVAKPSQFNQFTGKIAFQSDRDGDWEIYVMNADGSNLVQLTFNAANDEYPVWSSDGQLLAFQTNRDGNDEIYIMNADGTNQRNLTNHPDHDRSPTWSPDGQYLLFDSERNNDLEIYRMKVDGSDATQFTDTMGKNILPDWSPDGAYIAYTGNRYLGWNVYVMRADQTEDCKITDGHGACRPDWSPDSKKIAYVSQKADGKGDIWIMNLDGSDKTQLTVDAENYDYHPAWSPDGGYIAYAKTPDKKTGNWELYLMTADGRQHVQLTNHPAQDNFPDVALGSVSAKLAERQMIVYEAETAPRTVGEIQSDGEASGERVVFAASASKQAGFLMYGPYQAYQPGEYVASFRIKTDPAARNVPVVRLDVASEAGQTILVQQELTANAFGKNRQYQEFQLPFTLNAPQSLEFRVFSFGNASVWVDQVTVAGKAAE